ncbi:hypothetical protein CHLNCDRAFT_141208 [Chlorella variabilis]|uniref:Major facilitator superfamily (MFS) profile domain-containing protein n=1 Tax=Chlorella variabilis TaxID=554065 RepID=E1ZSB7_CHLVA|nr:hypothetical protein CHLNCDRAFT_141208 [Chlorella variabilis]EFN51219.1 hypothetical protein CHLNCDRAFT_141208 [Chlorella variabilis]|eukprot:XP_005843321.1 hypothetical protein CHLNCDRAFT_141208 [Chlorella variabilis]
MAGLGEDRGKPRPFSWSESLHDYRLRSVFLINIASILEKCDEQILPAVYNWVGASFNATPKQLGAITLGRAMMQALSSPLGGVAGHFMPRGTVIAAGCWLWATMTALFACTTRLYVAMPICAMNGVGLALVIPNVHAMAGLLNFLFVHDPTYQQHQQRAAAQAASSGGAEKLGAMVRRLAGEVGGVMKIPTFGIIIVQGIVGSVPYASLIFLTLYFQARPTPSCLPRRGGLGGLLGGWIGDCAARRFPDHGRIVATQFSVIVGVPFALLLFKGLPMDGGTEAVWLYRGVITAFALLTAWPAPCCNNPAFAEIVPAAQRNLIYAFDRCFEGAMAACSAPLVGMLAEDWFGFRGTSKVTGNRKADLHNAKALGSALLAFTTVPWIFCFLMYSGLHATYPRDRRRASERQRSGGREWEFEADAAAAAVAEEAVPLRERSTSPPRQRSSPTRMAASYQQADGQSLAQQLSREGSGWQGPTRSTAHWSAPDLR